MAARIVVTDHPYVAVTETSGAFKIVDVAPGNHTIGGWHERPGKVSRSVPVKAEEEVKVNIELSRK